MNDKFGQMNTLFVIVYNGSGILFPHLFALYFFLSNFKRIFKCFASIVNMASVMDVSFTQGL